MPETRPTSPRAASCRPCRSPRTHRAADRRSTRARRTPTSPSQDISDLHTYGKAFKTKWVTIHDTAVDGTDRRSTPTRSPRPRRGDAVQAAGERPVSGPGRFKRVLLRRDRRHQRDRDRRAAFGGFGARLQADARRPERRRRASSRSSTSATPATPAFDNVAFLIEEPGRSSSRTPATRCTPQRNALDSAYLFDVARRLLEGRQPAAALPRRGPRPVGDDRLRALARRHGFQNEGDNEITGIHVSNGDPTDRRHPRRQDPDAVRRRLARVLHPAARRQPPGRSCARSRHAPNTAACELLVLIHSRAAGPGLLPRSPLPPHRGPGTRPGPEPFRAERGRRAQRARRR